MSKGLEMRRREGYPVPDGLSVRQYECIGPM